ncbi:acyl-CoA dehydrogenase family protein [Dyadobacter tibetensis]|uniref:acyl-CoA dehydrogenase family protein n=1 Tax=Dyadobacter tibetensis TaxID=1211851 RepID=UPI000472C3D1|nr:acyl-CoA dehydrogenase family protein [Dyadobacter tibetensis]
MNTYSSESTTIPYSTFLEEQQQQIKNWLQKEYRDRPHGVSPEVIKKILSKKPLSVSIPKQYGGRGGCIRESMGLLSTTAYESLPLSLLLGINMFLFLQPVAKYADKDIQKSVFKNFLESSHMGGLMLTEPDYGSDALNLKTSHSYGNNGYHIKGMKHWQGPTGLADYWLVASRKRLPSGELAADIDFFISDGNQAEQGIEVQEYYDNLGLFMIPYGLNKIDIVVPERQKLTSKGTGIKMMLDILHNSRLQFPGMAMGFLKRILDEAIQHCTQRKVGGKSLHLYDNIQYQLAKLQYAYTLCSAMCTRSCKISGMDKNASPHGLEANSMKALITDLMQESAQILLQLNGSKGFRFSSKAGMSILDSRPFQIFEGPNELLYNQIAETALREMKFRKILNVFEYLSQAPRTGKASGFFKNELDFTLYAEVPQRKMILLGKMIAKVVASEYLMELNNLGYNSQLIESAQSLLHVELAKVACAYHPPKLGQFTVDYQENSNWLSFP